MTIHGAVTSVQGATDFTGWIHDIIAPSSDVKIEAILGDQVVGRSSANLENVDIQCYYGFHLTIKHVIRYKDLKSNNLRFYGINDSSEKFLLEFAPEAFAELKHREEAEVFDEISEFRLLELLEHFAKANETPIRARIGSLLPLMTQEPSSLMLKERSSITPSPFFIDPGQRSPNNVALVGLNGNLFVWGGSNALALQYGASVDSPKTLTIAQAWLDRISDRCERIGRTGMRFQQLIIPEKQSLLPDQVPVRVNTPTPLLLSLENGISKSPTLAASYTATLADFKGISESNKIFRKIDSHLSPSGALAVFNHILTRLNFTPVVAPAFEVVRWRSGDLGNHFLAMPFREDVLYPPEEWLTSVSGNIHVLSQVSPRGRGHVGYCGHWKNPSAAIPVRVLVFGNSFFERGGDCGSLSWWAIRWFREFKFHWRPSVDYDEIARFEPDIVICQTIERFLPGVPPT